MEKLCKYGSFQLGGDENSTLENAMFVTTAADGRLSAEVQQLNTWSRAGDMYVINFVYWYQNHLSGDEEFRKIDFKRGEPFACTP